MGDKNLNIYLNDHLAGSVAALELVEYLAKISSGTALEGFFKNLFNDIQTDQDTLKELMSRLGIEQSKLRKVTAWFMEKASAVKMHPNSLESDPMSLLQALEALQLGITGKKGLWRALATMASSDQRFDGFNFTALETRAEEQIGMVGAQCLTAAIHALR